MGKNKVILVWGCPGSGKSYYVKQNMKKGDLVIDLDLIKQAISMCNKTEVPDNLLPVVFGIRDYLYDVVEYRMVDTTIWVISGAPKQIDREYIINRLNVDDIVFINKSKEKIHEQILNDKERKDKRLQFKIVAKWFRNFEPPH